MLSLHEASDDIKKILKWGGLLIGLIVFVVIMLSVGKNIKEAFFPTPPPPPTFSFGKLPEIIFPKNANSQNLSYSLNTVSGTLPSFPDRLKIFKISEPLPNLLNLERARKTAYSADFKNKETQVSDSVYSWESVDPPFKTIILDTLSFDFNVSSSYSLDSSVLNADFLPSENAASERAQAFFNSLSSFPSYIDSTKTTTTLFNIEGQNLAKATSFSNAKIIRVDFFPKDIESLSVFYVKPKRSNMYALVGGNDFGGDILEANMINNNISQDFGTYYIKTAEEAFDELKNSNGYVANYEGNSNVKISNIYLAYFLGPRREKFLMPIVVFEGNNNFFAYVSAVKENWIEQSK